MNRENDDATDPWSYVPRERGDEPVARETYYLPQFMFPASAGMNRVRRSPYLPS